MAQFTLLVAQAQDANDGAFRVFLVLDDADVVTDPRGRLSYKVLAVEATNTSTQIGVASWRLNDGTAGTFTVQPGGSLSISIPKPKRMYQHEGQISISWG